jgi:hypothetical protein
MDGLDLDLGFEPIDLDETPADDNAEVVETPADDNAEVVAPEGETETPEGEPEEPTDGRKVPDEVRKALKAFRDASPENAKAASALRDSYGRELAYKAVFPTVKDAQGAQATLATIESYGGVEGIQTALSEIEEVDQLLSAGDPKAIDKIIEVAGDGFSKIAPAMLDKLQASNPDAYAAAIRPHLVDAIGKSGLSDAFGAVMQAMEIAREPGGSPEFRAKYEKQAAEGLSKIYQYLQNLGKQAPPTATQPVQQNEAFTKREQELAEREAKTFNAEVSSAANPKINQSLQKAMTPHLRGAKIDNTSRAEFTQAVYDEVAKLVKADQNYQRNKDAAFKAKTKDSGKIAQLMSAKFDEVVGNAAKTVASRPQWKALLGGKGIAPKAAPGTPAAPVAGKPVLVKELPNRNDVDWNKTTDDMMIRGIRVLKNGRTVKLDR